MKICQNPNFEINLCWSHPGTGKIGSDIHLIRYRESPHISRNAVFRMPSIAHSSSQGYKRVTLAKVASLYLHMQVIRVVAWMSMYKPRRADVLHHSINQQIFL